MGKISDWNGKTVIVTGASTGVGKGLCFELASRGAIVYVTARTKEKGQTVADEINYLKIHVKDQNKKLEESVRTN